MRQLVRWFTGLLDQYGRWQVISAAVGAGAVTGTIGGILAWVRDAPTDVIFVTALVAFVAGCLLPRAVLEVASQVRRWRKGPIRAWIKILYPQKFEGGTVTFPVQIVNRESAPLVLRATYEMKTDQGTYTDYIVSLDGRSQDAAITAKPDEPTHTTAMIRAFMSGPIPEIWKDRIKYPPVEDTNREHRLIFTDEKTKRIAAVSDKKDYDVL